VFKPLTSPNARLVNATIAHMDSASLRWIKTVDLSKRVERPKAKKTFVETLLKVSTSDSLDHRGRPERE
jgi:hypothetical protein